MTAVCGADMGGIWMEGPNGSRTFMPARCNRVHGISTAHMFMDSLSGLAIVDFNTMPERTVDARGCVRDH